MNDNRFLNFLKNNGFVILAFVIAIAGVAMPIIFAGIYKTFDESKLSPVGDWIGGTAAPLLSFAGFIMIYAAFIVQKKELDAQMEEFKLTRAEFQQQNETMALQRFENTFFHLVNLYNEIVNSIMHKSSVAVSILGRSNFERYYNSLKNNYHQAKHSEYTEEIVELNRNVLEEQYEKLFEKEQDGLGHYFRNLYHIYRFIDDTKELKDEVKYSYSRIIRAQLSTFELIMIMYNANSKYGREKFYPLIKKYDILQNMNKKLLIDPEHEALYNDLTTASN